MAEQIRGDLLRILITGGNGFIGKTLGIQLTNEKCDVFLWYKDNSAKTGLNQNEIFVDLLLQETVNKYIKELNFDVCIHCAGSSSVQDSMDNPNADFNNNVLTTRNLLEAIRIYSPKTKFIYLSSAAVYGETEVKQITEEILLNPISPYGYSKVCSELLIEQYSKIYNIDSAVLRIFSVYGPNMKKQVVYDIFKKFYDPKNEAVELFGSGEEKRDFIYIGDLVKVIKLIIQKDIKGVFNVASGNSISIKDLANIIKQEIGSSKVIKFNREGRKGDPEKWDVDISKLRSIGYSPQIGINEGIRLYHEWFRQDK